MELYTHFNVEFGPLEASLFNIFDYTKSGKLNFIEFVCAMWNFLTVPEDELSIFMYLMKDPSAVMRIKCKSWQHLVLSNCKYNCFCSTFGIYMGSDTDIMNMLEVVHKRRVDSSPALTMMFNEAKSKLPAEASMADFVKWAKSNTSLVSPLLILQIKMRKKLLGERYWVKLTQIRYDSDALCKIDYTKTLQANLNKLLQDSKQRMVQQEREKQFASKASLSASQKNIQEKEAVLMEKFLQKAPSSQQVVPRNSSADAGEEDSDNSPVGGRKARKSRPSSSKKPTPSNSNSNSRTSSSKNLNSSKRAK